MTLSTVCSRNNLPLFLEQILYKKLEREKWEQIKDIFDAALQRAPDEREQFLAENCNGDEELRRAVSELVMTEAFFGFEFFIAAFDNVRDFADGRLLQKTVRAVRRGKQRLNFTA